MSEQENFDDLIRQKFEEKEFVFNEENWEKAEKKIDSSRRLSKIFRWGTIFIIGLFSGIALTLLFVSKENSGGTKNISEINHQQENKGGSIIKENLNAVKSISNLDSNSQKENTVSEMEAAAGKVAAEKNSSKTNAAPITEKEKQDIDLSKKNLAENSLKEKAVSSNERIKETAAMAKAVREQNKISKKEKSLTENKSILAKSETRKKDFQNQETAIKSAASKLNKNNKEEKKSEKINLPVSLNQNLSSNKSSNLTPALTAEDKVKENKTKIDTETKSDQQEINSQKNNAGAPLTQNEQKDKTGTHSNELIQMKADDVKTGNETSAVKHPEINSEKDGSAAALNKTGQPDQTAASTQNTTSQSLSVQKTEVKIDSLAAASKQAEVSIPVKDLAKQKQDSALAAQNNLAAAATASAGGLASATYFSIEAGTNIEMGWNYTDASEARGFNPVLGIGITHYVNQKWSLYSGVQYGSIYYLKESGKVFSETAYSFGSVTTDKIIDAKSLHYAVLPIMLQFHINDKNTISIGGSVSYLLNSQSKVTTNTTTVTPMPLDSTQTGNIPNPVNTTQTTVTGYYSNAFNKWDASLAVGYRRRISQKFSVAAIANFGLLDVKNNTFFSQEKFERNIGLKIIISYNLFDF